MSKYVAIVVGASIDSIYAIQTARKMGFFVVAFDGDSNAPGLVHASRSFVVDIRDPNNIINILKKESITPHTILQVPLGRYLTTVGYINDYYSLRGVSFSAVSACVDKYKFHSILNSNNMRRCSCVLVPSGCLPVDITFPCVCKPRFGSGSREVSVITSMEEIESLGFPKCEDFIFETLISGCELGVDASVLDGKVYISLLRDKINTPFPNRQCVGYVTIPRYKNNNIYTMVQTHLQKIVSILGIDHTLLHADILVNSEGIFVIEMSPRPSGHYIYNVLHPKITGINLVRAFIEYAVPNFGVKSALYRLNRLQRFFEPVMLRYFDFNACKVLGSPDKTLLLSEYNLLSYECNINNTQLCDVKDGHSLMPRGYFILKGKNKQVLIETSKDILNSFILESTSV